MSYDDKEEEDLYDEDVYDEDIEIEDYQGYPSDEDAPYDEEEVQMLAPRIMAGQEDRIHYSAETAFGLLATTAEGALGKKIQKSAMYARSPEERFRDAVARVCEDAKIENRVRDAVIRSIPRIPDISYKNPGGCVLGYMAKDLVGKKLSPIQKRELDKVFEKAQAIKDKNYRISDLDVVRYARFYRIYKIA
jgi:hypothetical protein